MEGSSGLKRNSVIWLPLKGGNRGEDAVKELNAKKWDDVEVWSGKWVSSSRVCTQEHAFGGLTAQGGSWVHFFVKEEKVLLGFCPSTEPQVVSNGLPS